MGNGTSAPLDRLGNAVDFDPTAPVVADACDSEAVHGVLDLPRRERLQRFASLPESTALTCLCLEMSKRGSGLELRTERIGDRQHTLCFGGYDFVHWMKAQVRGFEPCHIRSRRGGIEWV
jgi:hypothetical protein